MRRSSRWSCPTITFLISKRSRPVSGGTAACVSAISLTPLVRRHAERACRCVDGHRETHAAERGLSCWIHESGHDPDNFAVPVDEWASGRSRVHGRVELDETGEGAALVGRLNGPVEATDHPGRERSREGERISDDDRVVADPQSRWIPKGGCLQLRRRIRWPERRDVAL